MSIIITYYRHIYYHILAFISITNFLYRTVRTQLRKGEKLSMPSESPLPFSKELRRNFLYSKFAEKTWEENMDVLYSSDQMQQ